VLLVACGDKDKKEDSSAPQPTVPTPIPATALPTATPEPLITPTIVPTLSYDIIPLAGNWLMRIDIAITGGAFADALNYNGMVEINIGVDGTVTGRGSFTPTLVDSECEARVLDQMLPTFALSGTTYQQDSQIRAQFTLAPDKPDQIENYALICPQTFNDVRYWRESVLWPALIGLNRLQWDIALLSDQTFTFEGDVTAGHLVAIVYVARD
jgi:hypothetical protein